MKSEYGRTFPRVITRNSAFPDAKSTRKPAGSKVAHITSNVGTPREVPKEWYSFIGNFPPLSHDVRIGWELSYFHFSIFWDSLIIIAALLVVLRARYVSGRVTEKYRSKLMMRRLSTEALLAK